jgi:hypothetical protein
MWVLKTKFNDSYLQPEGRVYSLGSVRSARVFNDPSEYESILRLKYAEERESVERRWPDELAEWEEKYPTFVAWVSHWYKWVEVEQKMCWVVKGETFD